MHVVSITERFDEIGGTVRDKPPTWKGPNEYIRTFHVEMSDRGANPYLVCYATCPAGPVFHIPGAAGPEMFPQDIAATVREREAHLVRGSDRIWLVTVRYSSEISDVDDPLIQPPDVVWDDTTSAEEMTYNPHTGARILNSASDSFERNPTRDLSRPKVVIAWNCPWEGAPTISQVASWRNTTNGDGVWSDPDTWFQLMGRAIEPNVARITGYHMQGRNYIGPAHPTGIMYYRITATLEFKAPHPEALQTMLEAEGQDRANPWDAVVDSRGMREKIFPDPDNTDEWELVPIRIERVVRDVQSPDGQFGKEWVETPHAVALDVDGKYTADAEKMAHIVVPRYWSMQWSGVVVLP